MSKYIEEQTAARARQEAALGYVKLAQEVLQSGGFIGEVNALAKLSGAENALLDGIAGHSRNIAKAEGERKPACQFLGEQKDGTFASIREAVKNAKQKTRDRIVAQAKADVARLIVQVKRKQGTIFDAKFTVNRDKRTVAARFQKRGSNYVPVRGIAKCAPDDCFNAHIGKAISLRRALGLDVPAEYLNVPQPTEVRVGDVIELIGIVGKEGEQRVIKAMENNGVDCRFTNGYWTNKRYVKIIDDSRVGTELGVGE